MENCTLKYAIELWSTRDRLHSSYIEIAFKKWLCESRFFFVATVVDKQTTDAVCALAMHRVHIERFIDLFA